MKTASMIGAAAVLLLMSCGCGMPTAAEAQFLAAVNANPALGAKLGEVEFSRALFTQHEHGQTVWVSKPSTGFYQLLPAGDARFVPDPIMEESTFWESSPTMRALFPQCEHPLMPPTGGAAKLWVASPETWVGLGCVKGYQWHTVYSVRTKNGFAVGPFPKGAGRPDTFVLVVVNTRWRNEDVPALPTEIAKLPGILMGTAR